MKYKAAIFDLDGTLADTMNDLQFSMNTMLTRFGWKSRTRDELLSFINRGARIFVARSMPDGSYNDIEDDIVTKALTCYSGIYKENICNKTKPYDDMPELLGTLKKQGMKLAVLSNKDDAHVKTIAEKLFPGVFDIAAGHLDYPEKPDPAAALAIADAFNLSPEECIFVGDSDIDMITANNAGMYAVGVSWGYRPPDVLESAGASSIVTSPHDIAAQILFLA